MVTDRKISVNEVQYRQALALAELGIADGMGRYAAGVPVSSIGRSVSSEQGIYQLTASSAAAIHVGTPPNTLDVTPVVLRAEATLADGLGKAKVEVQVAGYSLMADAKAVPLMGLGIGPQGSFEVAANPNGGGPGVPLSAWSNQPIVLGTGTKTCNQDVYTDRCDNRPEFNLSDNGLIGPDIQGNDPAFPSDMLLYLFGEPDTTAGWDNMNDKAVASPPNSSCGSLGPSSTGIYIVEGDCDLPNKKTGSLSSPVVLIVKDGTVNLNGDKEFNGIIFVYSSTIPSKKDFNGSATINGALIFNTPPRNLSGNFHMKYDQTVISNIQTGAMFQATKMVPGSWRDWWDEEEI